MAAAWHDEFPLRQDICYLNHAAVGVWPARTAAAVRAFADENLHQGAAGYPGWLQRERQLRRQLARLIHAGSEDDIALVKNTSEGLSLIAFGLDWQAGDNIVSTRHEFPSNRMVWQALEGQGVELRLVDVETAADAEAALAEQIDARTRLLSVSSVQYVSGFRLDLECLGGICRRQGVLFCIDAIQSLGALDVDVRRCRADFVVADGHKWLLGPEGLAVFYSRPEARERLRLLQYGWHMVERCGDFDAPTWRPAASARRFEPGSPNMLGIHALAASLSLFEEIGMQKVEKLVLDRARALRRLIRADDRLVLTTSDDPCRQSGVVCFRGRGRDERWHAWLYRELMQGGVICALRDGAIRLSPHFYTPDSALERFRHRLDALLSV